MFNPKLLGITVLFLTVLMTPVLVLAQYGDAVNFIWVRTFGFQASWLNEPRLLILNAIIPTIAIYAVFLGLLRTIGLMQGAGNMEHVIALVVTFAGLFSGAIGWVSGALAFLGIYSFVIFFILFIIGGVLYTKGFWSRNRAKQLEHAYEHSVSRMHNDIVSIERDIGKVDMKLAGEKNMDENKRNRLLKKRAKLTAKKGYLLRQRRDVTSAYEDAET